MQLVPLAKMAAQDPQVPMVGMASQDLLDLQGLWGPLVSPEKLVNQAEMEQQVPQA